ncbi:hypothetical protein LMH87_002587 [Akanthomyces muscarius]|uniref:Uncharacterized protein n=1 Tax=Akanthomyces muscarius TaxID=2231603 RepID=A0A9W8Q8M7_AKAMU|nr:hypothetical protein LMH87_002587 [Akanthomyces muscarius]KAJ4148100.1 hypothetical protein LMH87_002587 [Akanthomyces muscarius]
MYTPNRHKDAASIVSPVRQAELCTTTDASEIPRRLLGYSGRGGQLGRSKVKPAEGNFDQVLRRRQYVW